MGRCRRALKVRNSEGGRFDGPAANASMRATGKGTSRIAWNDQTQRAVHSSVQYLTRHLP